MEPPHAQAHPLSVRFKPKIIGQLLVEIGAVSDDQVLRRSGTDLIGTDGTAADDVRHEPTGFEDSKTDITISFDDGTQVLTVTPAAAGGPGRR